MSSKQSRLLQWKVGSTKFVTTGRVSHSVVIRSLLGLSSSPTLPQVVSQRVPKNSEFLQKTTLEVIVMKGAKQVAVLADWCLWICGQLGGVGHVRKSSEGDTNSTITKMSYKNVLVGVSDNL